MLAASLPKNRNIFIISIPSQLHGIHKWVGFSLLNQFTLLSFALTK